MRKKNLATWDAIGMIANHLGINAREIGYAGLKDKNALTKQYISILKKHEEKLESFKHENIKFLERTYHNNKIRLGHLKGNRFFIRLKKVNPTAAKKLSEALKMIKKDGMPNFFGYQRFGADGNNYKVGEAILKGKRKERNVKLKRLYINAFQSHMFNLWLSRRLEINSLVSSFEPAALCDVLNMPEDVIAALKAQEHPFKIFKGDVLKHYPHGSPFEYEGEERDMERVNEKDVVPTGLLLGKRSRRIRIQRERSVVRDALYTAKRVLCNGIDRRVGKASTARRSNKEGKINYETPDKSIFTRFWQAGKYPFP
jgi:tRNA pseudouridine13 synthase